MTNYYAWLIAAAWSILLLAPVSGAPQTVGQLVSVRGRVLVAGHTARMLSKVHAGDLVAVGRNGMAEVVLFSSSVRYRLPGGSSAIIHAGDLAHKSGPAVQYVDRLGRVVTKVVDASNENGGTYGYRMHGLSHGAPRPRFQPALAGPPPDVARSETSSAPMPVLRRSSPVIVPELSSPSPLGIIRNHPVILRWAGAVNDRTIRIKVFEQGTAAPVIQNDISATVHELPLPPGLLKPGQKYTWIVSPILNGMTQGKELKAWLAILTPEQQEEWDQREKEAADKLKIVPEDPAPLLQLAQDYEKAEMFEDAIARYKDALKLRPGDETVQAALERLQANLKDSGANHSPIGVTGPAVPTPREK